MRIAFTLALLALAGAARAAPLDDVQRLGWLAGSWIQEKDGVTTREIWLPPLDGAMAGVGQTHRPGKPARTENMTITAEPAGATFTAFIQGQPPTPFVLQPGGKPDEAVFENKAHDFPQRVIYRRCGRDLCARIEGIAGGRPASQAWRYRRLR